MLIDELGAVVNLVVNHDIHVLLGVVLGNILVGELEGGRHGGQQGECDARRERGELRFVENGGRALMDRWGKKNDYRAGAAKRLRLKGIN